MKTKRFIRNVLIFAILVTVIFGGVKLLSDFIYDNYIKRDDTTLLESYQEKKEKCELLKAIKIDFIEEGKGIKLQEIPDNIKYEVKNKENGNIEFYYKIEGEHYSEENPYYATITLSKNYEVIDEVYGIELEDFEEYKSAQHKADEMEAGLYALMISFALIVILALIAFITYLTILLIRKKSRS